MYFSGKELKRMLYILGVFAGDLEVRLCKNCTVIFSSSRSIERCSFIVSARSQKFDQVDMLSMCYAYRNTNNSVITLFLTYW